MQAGRNALSTEKNRGWPAWSLPNTDSRGGAGTAFSARRRSRGVRRCEGIGSSGLGPLVKAFDKRQGRRGIRGKNRRFCSGAAGRAGQRDLPPFCGVRQIPGFYAVVCPLLSRVPAWSSPQLHKYRSGKRVLSSLSAASSAYPASLRFWRCLSTSLFSPASAAELRRRGVPQRRRH